MINKIIPVIHLLIVIFISFYAFIVPSYFLYDYLYFCLLILLQILWIFFNHECIFSYIYKKINYNNYQCGDTLTLDDFNELTTIIPNIIPNMIPSNINIINIVNNILTIFVILSILIVAYRSKIASIFLVFFCLIFIRFFYLFLNNSCEMNIKNYVYETNYKIVKKLYNTYYIYKIHDEINNTIYVIMIFFFIYITYKNRKKF